MVKVNNKFLLLEEEGMILNLDDIAYVNVVYSESKYKLQLSFTKLGNDIDIKYDTLAEAESRLHDIFKAMGAMR